MVINVKKSNVYTFSYTSKRKDKLFKCGNDTLEIVDKCVYLDLLLTEHLDSEKTVKYVAQSASRALGLLISKCKLAGGLPYNVYTNYSNLSCLQPSIMGLVHGDSSLTHALLQCRIGLCVSSRE